MFSKIVTQSEWVTNIGLIEVKNKVCFYSFGVLKIKS